MRRNLYKQITEKKPLADDSVVPFWTDRLAAFVLSPLCMSVLIAAVTLVTFVRVLNADFVMWDDDWVIYNNPNLGGLSLENLRLIFTNTTVSSSWYTPLTGLRWCITYHFWALDPFGYHLGNWLLHAADVVLVFLVLRKLLLLGLSKQGRTAVEQRWVTISAALAALVWSLHPLRVEVVAWAAGAYGQMLLFLLISLLCYLRSNEPTMTVASGRLYLSFSVISFVASLLSQPFALSFVVVFFVLDVFFFRRLGGSRGWWRTATARRAILEKIPFIAAIIVVVLVNLSILAHSTVDAHTPVSLAKFGIAERFMQAMYVWAYYAWRPWYPINLSPVYTTFVQFKLLSLPFVASGLAVAGATVALVLLRRRWPLGLALGICHLVLLVPVLGLLEHPHYHVDRYSLIVSILWSVLLATWLANPKVRRFSRYLAFSLSIVAIVALGMLSFRQTKVWNNSVSLFEHMIRTLGNDPYRSDIHWRLGIVLVRQGNTEQAIEHFQRTLEIVPNHTVALYHLGLTYVQLGKYDLAIQNFNKLLRIEPDHHDAHYNIGIAFLQKGKLNEAIQHFNEALRVSADWHGVHNNLGVAYTRKGEYDMAIQSFNKALQLNPGNLGIIKNLEKVLKKKRHKSDEDY